MGEADERPPLPGSCISLPVMNPQCEVGPIRQPYIRGGGGNAVPAGGVEVSGEVPRRIEADPPDVLPSLLADDGTVQLRLPDHFELFALGVVICTDERNRRAAATAIHLMDEPIAGSDPNDRALRE